MNGIEHVPFHQSSWVSPHGEVSHPRVMRECNQVVEVMHRGEGTPHSSNSQQDKADIFCI